MGAPIGGADQRFWPRQRHRFGQRGNQRNDARGRAVDQHSRPRSSAVTGICFPLPPPANIVGRPSNSGRSVMAAEGLYVATPTDPGADRGRAVRRPRRRDQHHAAHPAGPGRRGHPPRPQPLGRRGRRRGDPGGRRRGRDQLLPGRPRRVLRVPRADAAPSAAPGTSGSTAAAAARSCPSEIDYLHSVGVARIFSPRGRPAARPGRHGQHDPGRVRPSRATPPRRQPSDAPRGRRRARRLAARSSPRSRRARPSTPSWPRSAARGRRARWCSASPAPAAPASRR